MFSVMDLFVRRFVNLATRLPVMISAPLLKIIVFSLFTTRVTCTSNEQMRLSMNEVPGGGPVGVRIG